MKKLLMNNVKKIIATCPCCGYSEEECVCTTLEELGATELELDFAISGKYANITYISSSSTYSYNSKSWQIITDSIKLSVLTSYNTKMAELGRVNATNYGTDYYGRYISDSNCIIYWNRTDYGTPNITLLNKLLAFTDEQLGHLKTYGKCVIPCGACGEVGTNCHCATLEQLDLTDIEVDFRIARQYAIPSSSFTSSSSTTYKSNGYTFRACSSSVNSTQQSDFNSKMTQLGRKSGTDYYVGKPTSSSYYSYIFWNETLYGSIRSRFTGLPTTIFGEEQLNQLDTYGKLDISSITSMYMMFYYSTATQLDLSNWDTSNVKDMSYIFYYCSNLTSLDLSNWDTSNVTTMSCMFQNCSNLTSLDVSNFNTSNVTNMGYMFNVCSNLTSLDVSNFNTSNVTNMAAMFCNCTNLTSLDMSNCDIGKVTNTGDMFKNCTALTDFKAPKNINYNISFSYSNNLTHDSLMSIINNLATVSSSKTLTLGSTNKAKLTSDEIAIATNKGWTVS